MTKTFHAPHVLFLAIAMQLAFLSSAQAFFGPSSYGAGDLTVKEVQAQQDGSVRIVYQTMAETMWSHPGVIAKTTAKGLELTFVRTRLNKKPPKVDYTPKRISKDSATVVITVPAKGAALFMKDGKKLVPLHPKPAAE